MIDPGLIQSVLCAYYNSTKALEPPEKGSGREVDMGEVGRRGGRGKELLRGGCFGKQLHSCADILCS